MIGRTFIHYISVKLGIEVPQTQTTEAERALLKEHLSGKKRIVEIGVFEGLTTRLFAESSDPDAVIYGVDPFFTGRLGISWGRRIAVAYNRQHLASGKLKLVPTLSILVGDQVPKRVDYVFIDGDHSLDSIKADWAFWSERIDTGGIIALHDTILKDGQTQSNEFGSHQYFRSHIQHDTRFEIIAQRDSLSILQNNLGV